MEQHQQCKQCGVVSEMAKGGACRRKVCKPCWNINQKAWRLANKESWAALQSKYSSKKRETNPQWVLKERQRAREYWRNLRVQALSVYGAACACCGEAQDEFLSIDHVNNDGAAHRRSLKTRGAGIWKWLRDQGYPRNFQTLCMNCNFGKHKNGGVCPHVLARKNAS